MTASIVRNPGVWADRRNRQSQAMIQNLCNTKSLLRDIANSAIAMLDTMYLMCKQHMGEGDPDPFRDLYGHLGNAVNWVVFAVQQAFFEHNNQSWCVDTEEASLEWSYSVLYGHLMQYCTNERFEHAEDPSNAAQHTNVPRGLQTAHRFVLGMAGEVRTGKVQVFSQQSVKREDVLRRMHAFVTVFRMCWSPNERVFGSSIEEVRKPTVRHPSPPRRADSDGDDDASMLAAFMRQEGTMEEGEPSAQRRSALSGPNAMLRPASRSPDEVWVRARRNTRAEKRARKRAAKELKLRMKEWVKDVWTCINGRRVRNMKCDDVSDSPNVLSALCKAAGGHAVLRRATSAAARGVAKSAVQRVKERAALEAEVAKAQAQLDVAARAREEEEEFKRHVEHTCKFREGIDDPDSEAMQREFYEHNPYSGKRIDAEVRKLSACERELYRTSRDRDVRNGSFSPDEIEERDSMRNAIHKKCRYPTYEDSIGKWIKWRYAKLSDQEKKRFESPLPPVDKEEEAVRLASFALSCFDASKSTFRLPASRDFNAPADLVDFCTLFGFASESEARAHLHSASNDEPWEKWLAHFFNSGVVSHMKREHQAKERAKLLSKGKRKETYQQACARAEKELKREKKREAQMGVRVQREQERRERMEARKAKRERLAEERMSNESRMRVEREDKAFLCECDAQFRADKSGAPVEYEVVDELESTRQGKRVKRSEFAYPRPLTLLESNKLAERQRASDAERKTRGLPPLRLKPDRVPPKLPVCLKVRGYSRRATDEERTGACITSVKEAGADDAEADYEHVRYVAVRQKRRRLGKEEVVAVAVAVDWFVIPSHEVALVNEARMMEETIRIACQASENA